MKRLRVLFLIAFTAVPLGAATKAVKKRPVARKAGKVAAGRSKPRGASARGTSARSVAARARRPSAPAAPARQSQPTPERYREIQQALADKGYLKTPASGTWDADSQDAMRRFQADRKLEQTGKLNSLSLIGLGLGPKPADEAAARPPSAPPQR